MMTPGSIVEHSPGVEWDWLGEELVVLDRDGRMLRGLNLTGARVWELIDSNRSIREISEVIAGESSAPVGRVLEDVLCFINELFKGALVQVSPPALPGDIR